MMKGVNVLFATGLAFLENFKKQILELSDLASLFMLFDQIQKSEDAYNQKFFLTLSVFYYKLHYENLERVRESKRPEVEEELQSIIAQRDQTSSNAAFKKMQMISKFYLQAGMDSGADYLGDQKSTD